MRSHAADEQIGDGCSRKHPVGDGRRKKKVGEGVAVDILAGATVSGCGRLRLISFRPCLVSKIFRKTTL